MAYTYHLDPAERLARITFTGTVTAQNLVQALADLLDDPEWERGFHTLWDFRHIQQLLLDTRDFQRLARLDFAFMAEAGSGRDALLVSRALDRTMARIFVHTARDAPRQSALFDTEAEARAWLLQARRQPHYRLAA